MRRGRVTLSFPLRWSRHRGELPPAPLNSDTNLRSNSIASGCRAP